MMEADMTRQILLGYTYLFLPIIDMTWTWIWKVWSTVFKSRWFIWEVLSIS